ncbi:hypothetical protein BVRB_5g112210 [Beta vulgaris subsp. vulgaris]|nr:hypothetical protein BVRB_5g112210 [Beta vulgaris subsp. vulgaris]
MGKKSVPKFKWKQGGGTGTLGRHLKEKHGMTADNVHVGSASDSVQGQLHGYFGKEPGGGKPFFYNRDAMIDGFSKYVILDELPFNHGESSKFEEWNRTFMQPQYRRIPRNTLKRHTQQLYYKYRGHLIEMFLTIECRVSLTCDTWTSFCHEPFICVTAHWVDDDWYLQKRIICFEAMDESHSGFNLKTRIMTSLKTFNLNRKVFSLSLDNATANTKCIDYLKVDTELPLLIDGALLHVRCCAHILNLSVQEGIHYDIESYIIRCKHALEALYDNYVMLYDPEGTYVAEPNKAKGRYGALISKILKKPRMAGSSSSLSSTYKEFNEYYALQYDIDNDFDILKWWKQHCGPGDFPILARIARDILAVPASTIASESTFSACR